MLQRGLQDRGGGGERSLRETSGREESRVRFSNSPFLVVRMAGSPQGKFRPPQCPITDLTPSAPPPSSLPRPPTDRDSTDYSLRATVFKTQPSTLHIFPPNLETNARLSLPKSPVKVLVLDPVDADLHFCDNILITFVFAC